jgi:iron(III) transport system permease protein
MLALACRPEYRKFKPRDGTKPAFRLESVLGSGLLWVSFLAPGVLLGILCIWIFNRPYLAGIYHHAGIVLIAWSVRYLAIGWHGVKLAVEGVDADLTDMGRLCGASGWSLLRVVHWAQIRPQVCAAWYLTYLLTLWDVETLILIYPPGGETLALHIFNLLHYGHNAQVNALCFLLLLLAVAPLGLWSVKERLSPLLNRS